MLTGSRTTGPSQDRQGALTSAMRAATRVGPKVLRIGLVEHDRLIHERVFDRATRITIGPTERCTFVIPARDTGVLGFVRPQRLFEPVGDGYELHVHRGMRGQILLPTGVVNLEELVRASEGPQRVRLGDEARGKIAVGSSTFLFQFVPALPLRTKPRLPAALTRGTVIDRRTTLLAGLSFLLHFLALGALYSDWTDPVVDEDLMVAGLVETLPPLPPVPPEVRDEADDRTRDTAKVPSKPAPGERRGSGSRRASGRSAANAALVSSLDRIEFQTVGALRGSGPAVRDVLGNREVPMTALDAAASSNRGIGFDPDGFVVHGSSTIAPGARNGLEEVGTVNGAQRADSGKRDDVRGPNASAQPGAPRIQVGRIPDAGAAIARLTAGLRRCYERGLTENPEAQGQIQLTFAVGENGEVDDVTATSSGNLPASVVTCVRQRAAYAHFSAPGPGGGAVSVPVKFVRQK